MSEFTPILNILPYNDEHCNKNIHLIVDNYRTVFPIEAKNLAVKYFAKKWFICLRMCIEKNESISSDDRIAANNYIDSQL